MSLVNQLLKDIEKRRGHAEIAEGLKASEKEPGRRMGGLRRWLLIVAAAAVLGALLVVAERWLRQEIAPGAQQPAVAEIAPAESPGGHDEEEPEAAILLPSLTDIAAVAGNGGARLELQFDAAVAVRSFTLSSPDRLVLDLVDVNPRMRPAVTIPTDQSVWTGLTYEAAPHGGLRIVLELAEHALADVQSPAPDILIVELGMPAEPAPPPAAAAAPPAPQSPLSAESAAPLRRQARVGFEKGFAVLSCDAPFEYAELRLANPSRLVIDIRNIGAIAAYDASPPLAGVRELRHSLSADEGRLRLVFEMNPGIRAEIERESPQLLHIRFTGDAASVAESPPTAPAPVEIPIPAAPAPETSMQTVQRTLQTSSPRQRAEQAYREGIRLLTEGQRSQAEAKLRTALGHDASLHDARLALANALLAQGRVREAEIQLQEGLRIAPGEAKLAERYARLLVDRGDLPGAIGVLSAAPPPVELEPVYHALLAALLQRAGHHQAAADTYAALVDVRPEQGLWWAGLAISLEALRRPGAALNAYRQAAQDPRLSFDMARFVNERLAALQHLGRE